MSEFLLTRIALEAAKSALERKNDLRPPCPRCKGSGLEKPPINPYDGVERCLDCDGTGDLQPLADNMDAELFEGAEGTD